MNSGVMRHDRVDVVIPARNTEETIGAIVDQFVQHPAIGRVIVVVDADTTDDTAQAAWSADRIQLDRARGKGQCVTHGLHFVNSDWVAFCDSDLIGLTQAHISTLITDATIGFDRMTIGVPDVPSNYPSSHLWAWSWVSGQRCLPVKYVRPLMLHGYLMETQINHAAKTAELPLNFEWLTGLRSEYKMTELRLKEMDRDARWGRAHGVI